MIERCTLHSTYLQRQFTKLHAYISIWIHFLQTICAKSDGDPCCDWVGEDGSGHFVKMVHNGIEYGDMQLICEAYNLMKDTLGMSHDGKFFKNLRKD